MIASIETTDSHLALARLPEWPPRTIAILATMDGRPYAIPVSAPVRAGDRRILIALQRTRGSLARLRHQPEVALVVLAEGNIAFTARGRAAVIAEPMTASRDYAAVAIEVEKVDDHRQRAFEVDNGIGRRWLDSDEQQALGARIQELRQLAAAHPTETLVAILTGDEKRLLSPPWSTLAV